MKLWSLNSLPPSIPRFFPSFLHTHPLLPLPLSWLCFPRARSRESRGRKGVCRVPTFSWAQQKGNSKGKFLLEASLPDFGPCSLAFVLPHPFPSFSCSFVHLLFIPRLSPKRIRSSFFSYSIFLPTIFLLCLLLLFLIISLPAGQCQDN